MLTVVILTGALGNWQLNRAAEKIAAQQARDSAAASEPLVLQASGLDEQVAGQLGSGRPVMLTGRWLPETTVYLDNRSHKRQAGFHVFSVLELPGATSADASGGAAPAYVLVLRGWAPRDVRDRTALPAVPEQAGQVLVLGLGQADLEQGMVLGADTEPGPQEHLWQRLSLARFSQWSGLALAPVLVRQTEATSRAGSDTGAIPGRFAADGLVRDWITPGSMVDKHYGYAFQWFAMSLAMLSFWVWLTFLRKSPKSGRAVNEAATPGQQ